MKRSIKKISCLILVLMLVGSLFLLTSCKSSEENAEIKADTVLMLNALLNDDADAAYALLSDEIPRKNFDASFPDMCELVDGIESYDLMQTGWNTTVKNGESVYTATYSMTADNGRLFQVEVTLLDGEEGFYGFYITENVSFATENNANLAIRIVLWIYSALVIAFAVWMIVDCARRKMSLKPLFIIIILIGVTVGFTANSENVNFNGGLGIILSLSDLFINYGTVSLNIFLPVGAIVYFALRKKLTANFEQKQKAASLSDDLSADLSDNLSADRSDDTATEKNPYEKNPYEKNPYEKDSDGKNGDGDKDGGEG